jgi:4-amino-4-deoxychorismate lyase
MQQIQQCQLTQGGIKVILSGGTAARGLVEHGKDNVLLFQSFPYQRSEHPLKLVSSPWVRDASNPLYQVKTINYLEAVLAKRYALSQGAEDVLFFNMAKHATETCIANFFMIRQDSLFTPPLRDGVLPGITRQRIISLCKEQQIDCNEVSITLEMIAEAEVLFCCNSLQGIRLISSLNELNFNLIHPLLDELKKIQ